MCLCFRLCLTLQCPRDDRRPADFVCYAKMGACDLECTPACLDPNCLLSICLSAIGIERFCSFGCVCCVFTARCDGVSTTCPPGNVHIKHISNIRSVVRDLRLVFDRLLVSYADKVCRPPQFGKSCDIEEVHPSSTCVDC